MIDLSGIVSMAFLKKSRFTGSEAGMRFLLEKAETEEGGVNLLAAHWPEPYGYDATQREQVTEEFFSFDKAGMDAAVEWLNRQHQQIYHT